MKAAQLKEFLRFAKMENLIASWVKEEIDLDDLIESDELDEDLIDLGLIKKGPRMKFKKAMKKWKRLDSQNLYWNFRDQFIKYLTFLRNMCEIKPATFHFRNTKTI